MSESVLGGYNYIVSWLREILTVHSLITREYFGVFFLINLEVFQTYRMTQIKL